jgi:hypothetical protein
MMDSDLASGLPDSRRAADEGSAEPAAAAPEPERLLGVLADGAKLRVFAALVLAAPAGDGLDAAQAAAAAGIGAAQAARALEKLAAVDLVREGAAGYLANPVVLRESLGESARRRAAQRAGRFATDDPEQVAVLLKCFEDGRLVYLPEKFGKRLIVLDEIAQRFEPGTRYAEAEVNMVLQELYPDYAALRRYLVDSALLTRQDGYYWRSGGTVPA